MILLLDDSVFLELDNNYNKLNRNVANILHNEEFKIILNKQLEEHYHSSLANKELFQSLITELIDENRIESIPLQKGCTGDELFFKIYRNFKNPQLIPLCINKTATTYTDIGNLVDLKKIKKFNREWIANELLTNNLCNVSHLDFSSDGEIVDFVSKIFQIPKYIAEVSVYCREMEVRFLDNFKGKHIYYHTLRNKKNINDLREDLKTLKNMVSGKAKLFYTGNPRKIHERKIVFGSMLITFDNSLENICAEEPTWEIYINVNQKKAKEWQAKKVDFSEVF